MLGFFGLIRIALFGSITYLELAIIVLALMSIVFISIVIGAILPLFFYSIGLDPANSSTTIQVIMDISGMNEQLDIYMYIYVYFMYITYIT